MLGEPSLCSHAGCASWSTLLVLIVTRVPAHANPMLPAGAGGFGTVFKALRDGSDVVAVKILNTPCLKQTSQLTSSARCMHRRSAACQHLQWVQSCHACTHPGLHRRLQCAMLTGSHLAQGHQDARTTAAFIRETQILSSARHPNILQL